MVILTEGARDAASDAVVDLIDVGSTDANGDLVIRTSGDAEIAILAMSIPAFLGASVGVNTADTISDDTNATGGIADNFIFQDRNNAEVLEGTVGSGSGDLDLSSVSIGAGDTVSVTAFTVTMPAS